MRSSTSSDGAVSLQPLTPSTSNAQSSGPRGRLSGLSTSQPRIKSQHQQSTQSQSSDSTASRSSSASRIYQALRWFCVDQWFLIALSCLIILSSQVQVPAVRQKTKETAVTYACVSLIFFITGCTLPTKVLMENYAKWKIHLFVQVQSYLMTSATTFAVVSICATNPNFMDPWLLIGLIFAGCVPTTISSNVVMTRQAHGNTALTVVQSTIGNFLGPFLTPVLVKMYTSTGAWYTRILPTATGGYGEIYRRVFKQLGLSLFLPMTVGQIVQNVFPSATKKVMADWKLSKLGSLSLLVIIWQTFDQAFETGAFESVKGSNMVFIVFISLAFYAIWLGIGFGTAMLWLPKKDVIAACYCIPAKTPAMGVPLTTVLFLGIDLIDESKIQIPMVIFQGFQIFQGSLLTIVFRRWIEAEEELKSIEKPSAEVEAEVGSAQAEKAYHNKPRAADNS